MRKTTLINLSIINHQVLERILRTSLAGAAVVLFGYWLWLHISLVWAPGPLEYREGTILLTTHMILSGENPYVLHNLPQHTNVYGLAFNLVVAPLAKAFGVTFFVHRLVAGLFLVASCVVVSLFLLMRRAGPLLSGLGGLIFYCQLVSTYTTIARPDALGLFLFLMSLYVPVRLRYSGFGLGWSIVLGMAAFLTKPYFVFGVPCLALYLFLAHSKRLGGAYFAAFLGLTALVALLVSLALPYYWHCTFFTHSAAIALYLPHLFRQCADFAWMNLGVLLVLLIHAGRDMTIALKGDFSGRMAMAFSGINVRDPQRPLLERSPGLISISLISALAVLLVRLGWNTGAYMIYFHHLASPFLIIFGIGLVARRRALRVPSLALIFGGLVVLCWERPVRPAVREADMAPWIALLAEVDEVLLPGPLVHLLIDRGLEVYDNGHTEYFRFGFSPDIDKETNPGYLRMKDFVLDLRKRVQERRFDLIFLAQGFNMDFFPEADLEQGYRLREVGYVPGYYSGNPGTPPNFVWAIEIWEPKYSDS